MERYATSRELIAGKATMWAMLGGVCWILGVVFAILGIIADAMNGTLGLESASWLLLAIATFVISAIWYLSWAVAMYLRTTEAKKAE